MSLVNCGCVCVLALSSLAACADGKDSTAPHRGKDPATSAASFTLGTGSTSTLLARSTFGNPTDPQDQTTVPKDPNFKVKRMTGNWQVEIKSMPALDLAVQSIVFNPGSQSGWHSHPGPVFIQVVSGTITFYESDDPNCTPIRRSKGESYLDLGDHAHIARNETDAPAQNIVTYFAPPGAALRIDEPRPGNCPF